MHSHLSFLAAGIVIGITASVLFILGRHWVITAKAEAAQADAIYTKIVHDIATDAGHIEAAHLEPKDEPPSTPSTKT